MQIDIIAIRVLMASRGINQKELARISNVRESTISNIMRNKSNGKPKTWKKIADGLHVDVLEILKKEQTQ